MSTSNTVPSVGGTRKHNRTWICGWSWTTVLPWILVLMVLLYIFMYIDLPSFNPGVYRLSSFLAGLQNHSILDYINFLRQKTLRDPFSEWSNGTWSAHYSAGIPVPPTKTFQRCDEFIKTLKYKSSQYHLLAMYDPGNCAEIPHPNVKLFPGLSREKEQNEYSPGLAETELTTLCAAVDAELKDPNWRLCYGMPAEFHFGKWVHQRYVYSRDIREARKRLGQDCFEKRLALFFNLPNMDHEGGPRKVLNNLLSGFRLIGKPYIINARKLRLFDILFSPDPHHGFFMYFMDTDLADKFYIGPTVKWQQFDTKRITTPVRQFSHVVGASRQALFKSDQYFPKMPLNENNAVIVPTGVDEMIFRPGHQHRSIAIVYAKNGCNIQALGKIMRNIKERIVIFNYGSYTESQFRKSLRRAKYGIVCDGAESQGIAIEEMMAMNVPLYVVNPHSVPYFSNGTGLVMPEGQPIHRSFKRFLNKVNKGVYKPRKWLVENLGIVEAVINTMLAFCGIPNKWNPAFNNITNHKSG